MSGAISNNTILCAGRLYCDLVFTGVPNLPTMGTETFAENLTLHAGGGAFITAAAFSALGWQSSLLATLPAPPFDEAICAEITASGVLSDLCHIAEKGASPQLTVAIAGAEDRAFLSNKSGKAIPEFDIGKRSFRHLHIGELRTLVEHPDLIVKARSSEMSISLDCAWDAELLSKGAEMEELITLVDVFLPNESEFALLTQSGLDQAAAPLTIVKCGSDGARAHQNGAWTSQKTEETPVVDATGAGDAFNGGFLSSWLAGQSLNECLATGNRCGMISVGHAGGTGGMAQLRNQIESSDQNQILSAI